MITLFAAAIGAQDVGLPKADAPAASPSPSPARPAELIPPDLLPPPSATPPVPPPDPPSIKELDESLKPKPRSAAAENYRLHIEWRKIRNQVQNDAKVKAALAEAEKAPTDLEKRKLLARYYQVFYARAAAIAPAELRNYLNDRKREALNSLPQPRVRPETTKLVPPPPTPVPAPPALPATPPPQAAPVPSPPLPEAASSASPAPTP